MDVLSRVAAETKRGRQVNDMLLYVLITAVAVIAVREAYRNERLGAALLVGVAVATLLLTLVGVHGSDVVGANPGRAGAALPSSSGSR